MKLGPRGKLLLIVLIFAAPIVASYLAYFYAHPKPTANHGELLLPPGQASGAAFTKAVDGTAFAFVQLAGRWILVAQDGGDCADACVAKLVEMRQVRLALGRNAERVARVFVVDDGKRPRAALAEPFEGMQIVIAPQGGGLTRKAAGDHGHIYLVDPHGNVMMRWRAGDDPKGMLRDLERLLRASQIG
jgi:cytochrome oxidase Cu insertion factor (SCO1/SenC/PrrC family)